jgi:hypothetical protein
MIKDGLYSAQFTSPLGAGSGVVVVNGNHFRGGDTAMAYVGMVSENDIGVVAELQTFRHTQVPGMLSVLGNDDAHVSLTGKRDNDNQITLSASQANFRVILNWIHD